MRWTTGLALAALTACGGQKDPEPKSEKAPAEAAQKGAEQKAAEKAAEQKAPERKAAEKAPGQQTPWPPCERVFTVKDGGAGELVLGAQGSLLWARRPGQGGSTEVWQADGPGVVQKVILGDLGQGPRLIVARGMGRGHLDAPITLEALDPATGKGEVIWRQQGPRSEVAHLSLADVDRDGADELAVTYYDSKYTVTTHHIEANGEALPSMTPIRMASSWAFGDISGDGAADQVIGRVYGDAKGVPGDLKMDLGQGWQQVPSDKGVRSVLIAKLAGDKRPALYFADGWVADYGKSAKAQIKRAVIEKDRIDVQPVFNAPGEFTFFDLEAVDIDGDGELELVARGNKAISLIDKGPDGYRQQVIASVPPILNVALGRDAEGRWRVYVPHAEGLRVIPVRLAQ